MRAAVLTELGAPLQIHDLVVDAPADHEVLVRTKATGLCHSDIHAGSGRIVTPVPTVLGHESAGVVEAVGAAVTSVRPGDHVVACLSAACGHCRTCTSGRGHLCLKTGLTRSPIGRPRLALADAPVDQFAGISGFAEQMLVHENALVPVPRELPFDVAAFLGCGVITGMGAALNTAAVRPGDRVAVIGCGGVGLNAVQGAHLAGASRLIAIDIAPEQLALALKLGATDVVDASSTDPVEAVLELTGGVDHAIEVIGDPATITQAFRMLDRGGSATVVGVPGSGSQVTLPGFPLLHERRVQGSFMGGTPFRLAVPAYASLYLQGRLNLDVLISGRHSLAHLPYLFVDHTALGAGRHLITFDA